MNKTFDMQTIDQTAETIRADYNVPGLALAIVKEDALIAANGYGLCRMDGAQPVDENTRFGIASISKSFTALALGMLVDEGKIHWSDPVTRYLPSFQLWDACASPAFTILDCLVHRSGLPEVAGGTLWYGTVLNRDQVIAGMRHLQPVSSFRSTYAYQNITYLVAGQIIPAVTGMSWDEFVQTRIFAPLGMRHSTTSIHDPGLDDNIAQPHVQVNGRLTPVPLRSYDNVGPAAAINTTAVDLAAYARLLLNNGFFAGRQLYSPQIARDLWTPHTFIPIAGDTPAGYAPFTPRFHNAYALGWVIQDIPGQAQKKVQHSGGIDGLRSLLTLIPDEKLAIIALANNETPAPLIMTQVILDQYWGCEESSWVAAALEEWQQREGKKNNPIQIEQMRGTSPSLPLDRYAGQYISQLIGSIEIQCAEEQLSLSFPNAPTFKARLSHWHYDTFHLTWEDSLIPDGLLTFILDAAGSSAEIRLEQTNLLDLDFSELHPIKRQGLG